MCNGPISHMLGKRAATHLRVEICESLSTAARAITPDMPSPNFVRLLSAKLRVSAPDRTSRSSRGEIVPNITHAQKLGHAPERRHLTLLEDLAKCGDALGGECAFAKYIDPAELVVVQTARNKPWGFSEVI